jgi:hypothetical protein
MDLNTQEAHRISSHLVLSAKTDMAKKIVYSWTRVRNCVTVKLNLMVIISGTKHDMKKMFM